MGGSVCCLWRLELFSVLLVLTEQEVAGQAVARIATPQAESYVVLWVPELHQAPDPAFVEGLLLIVAEELVAEALVVKLFALGLLCASSGEHLVASSLIAAVLEVTGRMRPQIVHGVLGVGVRA